MLDDGRRVVAVATTRTAAKVDKPKARASPSLRSKLQKSLFQNETLSWLYRAAMTYMAQPKRASDTHPVLGSCLIIVLPNITYRPGEAQAGYEGSDRLDS